MASTKTQVVGSVALGLSLLTFALYFLNVLIGGPLGMKPWFSDLAEVLLLLLAVILFVAGTISREAQAKRGNDDDSENGVSEAERS